MASKPYLTSDTIIEAVKRKISLPIYQTTFSEDDILRFANEEMMISQVPSVLQFHEEYFVTNIEVPIEVNRSRYPFPERSIGLRLRDIFYKDTSGNLNEMTRVAQDDRAYFQYRGATNQYYACYFEGHDVILIPEVGQNPVGSLLMVYYLRPNQLVLSDRIATLLAFSKTITVDNTALLATDTVTINGQVFTAVAGAPAANEFQIGATSNITAANLASAINANEVASATSANNIVTLSYDVLSFTFASSNTAALVIQATQGLVYDQMPQNIVDSLLIDFLQTKPGHRTYSMDVELNASFISGTTLNLDLSLVPEDYVLGDYIAEAGECFIPQIPTELHIGLVERICARILSSLGDQEGLNSVNDKIKEIEVRTGSLVDNRSEGTPQKVTQRHSILRRNKTGPRRRMSF